METSTKRKASADLQHEEESLKVNKKNKDLIANDSSEDQASTNVPGQPQRNTTPIHRGWFKSKWLSKHSSLLKRSRNAYGLLVRFSVRFLSKFTRRTSKTDHILTDFLCGWE